MEHSKQDDLADILQGKIIGRTLCHIWSDDNAQQVVYDGRVEKMRRKSGVYVDHTGTRVRTNPILMLKITICQCISWQQTWSPTSWSCASSFGNGWTLTQCFRDGTTATVLTFWTPHWPYLDHVNFENILAVYRWVWIWFCINIPEIFTIFWKWYVFTWCDLLFF